MGTFTRINCFGRGENGVITGAADYQFNGAKTAKDVETLIRAAPVMLEALERAKFAIESVMNLQGMTTLAPYLAVVDGAIQYAKAAEE